MDLEKRKRESEGEDDEAEEKITDKKTTTEPEDDDDDEELEEFFAILRRIREAVKYFKRDHRSGLSLMAKPWEPSFQEDDFEGDGDHHKGAGVKDHTPDSSGLVLNSEPASSRCRNATSQD